MQAQACYELGPAGRDRVASEARACPLNAVGVSLRPKVFCVAELADQGAGRPRLRPLNGKRLHVDSDPEETKV